MSKADYVHDEDCPCFGDEVPHSKDCANCECQPATKPHGRKPDSKTRDLKDIHKMCNEVLREDLGAESFKVFKQIRDIASGAWPCQNV